MSSEQKSQHACTRKMRSLGCSWKDEFRLVSREGMFPSQPYWPLMWGVDCVLIPHRLEQTPMYWWSHRILHMNQCMRCSVLSLPACYSRLCIPPPCWWIILAPCHWWKYETHSRLAVIDQVPQQQRIVLQNPGKGRISNMKQKRMWCYLLKRHVLSKMSR